ncbi:hypothetical protein BY458DRAFT_501716 [Sporodiniella umbellata]|nr:hypothetical protein BY458DRAFT_501716 [Sporodiniella umbellata]
MTIQEKKIFFFLDCHGNLCLETQQTLKNVHIRKSNEFQVRSRSNDKAWKRNRDKHSSFLYFHWYTKQL